MAPPSTLDRVLYWPAHPPSDADRLADLAFARGEVPTDPAQRERLLRNSRRLRTLGFAFVAVGCVVDACALADGIVGGHRVSASLFGFFGCAVLGGAAHRRVRLLSGATGPDLVLRVGGLALVVAMVLAAGVTATVELHRPTLRDRVTAALRSRLPSALQRLELAHGTPEVATHLVALTCLPSSSNLFSCRATYTAGAELRLVELGIYCPEYSGERPSLPRCVYVSRDEPLLPQGTLGGR